MNRRRMLRLCGTAVGTSVLAGCERRVEEKETEYRVVRSDGTDVQAIPEYEATHHPIVSDVRRLERLTHEKTNEARADHSRSRLSYDSELADIARLHSRDMGQNEYFGHENPDGELHVSRLRDYGYNSTVTYENLYSIRFPDLSSSLDELAQGAVDWWLDSPPHRKALLKEHNTEEGIGVYVTAEPRIYWTAELSKYDVDRQTPTP